MPILQFWELIDYGALMLVFAGCAGEVVHGRIEWLKQKYYWWERNGHTFSGYVLVIALAFELLAQIETNHFNHKEFKKLTANAKAASMQAQAAVNSATQAVATVNIANANATSASDAAARATQEANAAADRIEQLKRVVGPRELTDPIKQLFNKLVEAKIDFILVVTNDQESIAFAQNIQGYVRKKSGETTSTNASIFVTEKSIAEVSAFYPGGVETEFSNIVKSSGSPFDYYRGSIFMWNSRLPFIPSNAPDLPGFIIGVKPLYPYEASHP